MQLPLVFRTWGGRRDGAGRKPSPGRRSVPHTTRPAHDPRTPLHVTLRATPTVPSLRGADVFPAVRAAIAAASTSTFRVLHFSVQADHVHLVAESDGSPSRGCQGLAIRLARAVNRALRRRGAVWADRYHARALVTPREMRHALAYVLNNWRKHVPGARGVDPRSSGPWFRGWRRPLERRSAACPVATATTWLARVGWLRHGRIDVDDGPRPPRGKSRT